MTKTLNRGLKSWSSERSSHSGGSVSPTRAELTVGAGGVTGLALTVQRRVLSGLAGTRPDKGLVAGPAAAGR